MPLLPSSFSFLAIAVTITWGLKNLPLTSRVSTKVDSMTSPTLDEITDLHVWTAGSLDQGDRQTGENDQIE